MKLCAVLQEQQWGSAHGEDGEDKVSRALVVALLEKLSLLKTPIITTPLMALWKIRHAMEAYRVIAVLASLRRPHRPLILTA